MKSASSKPVIYACSGCSDAGELADRIARRLTQEGIGRMSCLAGVGAGVKHLVAVAEGASRILVIDGCPINCARLTLEQARVRRFEHLELHTLGLRKGGCPVTEENIARGVEAARRKLASAEVKDAA
jgi:uncharacterized metal-binding protein